MCPSLGPHPVKDLLVRGMVVDMLLRSLDPQRLSAFAKFYLFRSSQSDLSTVSKVYINRIMKGYSLGEENSRKTVLTKCSTQTIWFQRFVRGVNLRVGSNPMLD